MLKLFISLFSCFFSAFVFTATPTAAQTIRVRLFEIFHLHSIEISPAVLPSTQILPASNRSANSEQQNRLRISSAKDSSFFVSPSWMRIKLLHSGMQIQSADFNCALSSRDTINIAATDAYFFAMLPNAVQPAARRYSGALKIFAADKELCIVNLVPAEDYLAGILAAEMPKAGLTALQAQAVVSRTYLLKNWQRHFKDGYQFCDLTHCQTYKGSAGVTATISQAVADTKDEILAFEHQPIAAYYSSTCGGRTADAVGIWTSAEKQLYLKSVVDNFCTDSPHSRWRVRLGADSLHQIWQQRLGEPITAIAITKTGEDGRVRELAMMGNSLHLISGEDFRAVTCRRLGWNTLKSTAFDLRLEKNSYVFDGRGLGHGLGLCQYGAMKMAQQGYSYREILRYYFSEMKIQTYIK